MDTTYRLVALEEPGNFGHTARTPSLAKLVFGNLERNTRITLLAIEQTDWEERNGKPRAVRSVIVEAESEPGEWAIGTQTLTAA